MKRFFLLALAGMLIATAPGCESRRCWRNRNTVRTAPSATYEGMAPSSAMYSEQPATTMRSAAPSGGCGPGCNCGGKSIPMLSGPQAFAPGAAVEQ
jgi:hypothetical protein